MEVWDILKLLADATRLRIINLLQREELSVAELQEILSMGQSRISSHLALLRQGELVFDRKDGKRSYYALNDKILAPQQQLIDAACASAGNLAEIREDLLNLERILEKRRRQSEQYFNSVAGRLGKNYCPGRSWEAIGHFLLHLVPKIKIADLGAGEGVLSQLLAQHADAVYCIDNSPKMVEFGSELARKNNIENLYYTLGDIEQVPLEDGSVDLVLLSQALHHAQHPKRAIQEAFRILKPAGKIVILDLKEHTFEKAHELYADLWLGFSENNLYNFLIDAGFNKVDVGIVAKEPTEPFFETLLATSIKP